MPRASREHAFGQRKRSDRGRSGTPPVGAGGFHVEGGEEEGRGGISAERDLHERWTGQDTTRAAEAADETQQTRGNVLSFSMDSTADFLPKDSSIGLHQ